MLGDCLPQGEDVSVKPQCDFIGQGGCSMLAILTALVTLSAAPVTAATSKAKVECSIAALDGCRNTNVLVGDPAFARAVRRFVGPTRVRFLYAGPLNDQQMEVLGGPPDPPVRIGSLYRFTACRYHDCTEKGAVVLEPQGRIVATAVLHSTCILPRASPTCFNENVLSVFVRDPSGAKVVVDNLSAWASAEIATEDFGLKDKARLMGVEIYSVATGTPKRVTLD